MSDSLQEFFSSIEPFLPFWPRVRVSSVAAEVSGKWISLCTRLLLSYANPEKEVLIRPTDDFIAISSERPTPSLRDLLKSIAETGSFDVTVSGERHSIFLTRPHASSPTAPSAIRFSGPYSSGKSWTEGGFILGDSN